MSEIRNYLESKKEEMIRFLAEIAAIRSVQGDSSEEHPFGEENAAVLKTVLKKCEEYGFAVENVENYVGTADINEKPPVLGILTHLDVVPEGSGWNSDPFTLKRENGKLICRGAIDDKGPAVASIFALRAVKDLGISLKKGVRLIFGTNEENGSADLEYYRKKRELPPNVFTPDGEYPLINGEKGMLRVYFSAEYSGKIAITAGSVINAVPNLCQVRYENGETLIYRGKSAHASTPEKGENAITKFLEAVGEDISESLIVELGKLFPHGTVDGSGFGMGFSDDISGKMTCVITMLNTVENSLTGGIDIRFPLDRSKAEISEIVCGRLEAAGFRIESCDGTEPHLTSESSPFVQSLLKVYEKLTGEKGECLAIGGGTYVHEIEGGVAFGAEFPGEDGNMHGPDEFITEENLLKNAEIMAEAIIEIAGIA